MSQFESSFPPQMGPKLKTSALAIASLVCSLFFCCPLGTIPGVLLGIAALVSISANPMRRGRGVAITGIVLGVLFTVGQIVVYPKVYKITADSIVLVNHGPNEALAAGFAGNMPAFRDRFFKAGALASDQEATEFIGQLRSRYGEFVSGHPRQASTPPFGQTQMVMTYTLEFDRGMMPADVELVFADPNTGGLVFKLGSITVVDEQQGNLTYPPQPADPRPAGPRPDGG